MSDNDTLTWQLRMLDELRNRVASGNALISITLKIRTEFSNGPQDDKLRPIARQVIDCGCEWLITGMSESTPLLIAGKADLVRRESP